MAERADTAGRPRIVHVTADHPDQVVPGKTRAIADLIALTGDGFDNHVISLNRRGSNSVQPFAAGEAWTYRAAGKGVLHATSLRALGKRIAARLADGPKPDLLVGHKLTVEGLAVAEAAKRLGVPYALTLQGDTDTKILAARPDLRWKFRHVFQSAASVVAIAPWALERIEAILGKRQGATHVIPAPTELDVVMPVQAGGTSVLSVFRLASRKRKNFGALCSAAALAEVPLKIAGDGHEKDRSAVQDMAASTAGVHHIGPLARNEVAPEMNRAAAFCLPSRRESLGLVFIEAIFAGCPIIYPRGQAVSGYFDDLPFAIPVDSKNVRDIAKAMRYVVANEARLKAGLSAWREAGGLARFARPAIAAAYGEALSAAIGVER
ncbi:MAG: glycosyltransferase family 4 protein [Alteraurantiacibacter sp.]